jgi:type IV pilus assembly protein PilO
MPRNSKIALPRGLSSARASFSDPKFVVRLCLGVLLAANLVAAAFAFHLFDPSPEVLRQELASAIAQRTAAQARLVRSRSLAANTDRGKNEGEQFLNTYMATRKFAYSTIIKELLAAAKEAGIDKAGDQISLNPIPGSDDLDMMSITMTLEPKYGQLVRFINLLDRSPRFLIIESLTVAPRSKSDILTVNVKLDTFVKDDKDGTS